MVGIERTVVPLIGTEEFGIASTTLVVSFIVSFGVVKAFANLVSGQLADKWGRKRVLILGWLFGLPVPFMIIWAPSWRLGGCRQRPAWRQPGLCLVDDGHHEDRSGRAEEPRPGSGPQRIRRLSRRRRDRFPDRLSGEPLRAASGSDLPRRRLRGARDVVLGPARAGHARARAAGSRQCHQGKVTDRASGRYLRSRPFAIAISSLPRRPGSSTISTTA